MNLAAPCVVWTGPTNPKGYGWITVEGKHQLVHRFVWELCVGPIPPGLCVCHGCDNPPCRNIDHLFLGTKGENSLDMFAKGRNYVLKGEEHGMAKLTWEQAEAIRRERILTGKSYPSLGRQFGVSTSTAFRVVKQQNWKLEVAL